MLKRDLKSRAVAVGDKLKKNNEQDQLIMRIVNFLSINNDSLYFGSRLIFMRFSFIISLFYKVYHGVKLTFERKDSCKT